MCQHYCALKIDNILLLLLQESLRPDLVDSSNLNRTASSSGELNQKISYNDLCFPKTSNYGSMKKKKQHSVGVDCRLARANAQYERQMANDSPRNFANAPQQYDTNPQFDNVSRQISNASPRQQYNPSPRQEYNPSPRQEYNPSPQSYLMNNMASLNHSPARQYSPHPYIQRSLTGTPQFNRQDVQPSPPVVGTYYS